MDCKPQIRKFIVKNILAGAGSLRDEESLLEQGLIDSTGVLELVAFIEETYKIKVDDDELVPENLDSVNQIASYIQNKLAHVAK